MKYVKMLGLAAVAAAALMAFVGAGTASATILTCTEPVNLKVQCKTGTTIHAVNEGTLVLTGGFKTIECKKGTVHGTVTEAGSATTTVKGTISALTFEECNCEVVVVKSGGGGTNFGTLEIHTENNGSVANNNGTLTGSESKVTVNCSTIFGNVHCIYVTNATHLGTLTGSSNLGGSTATLDVTAEIPRENTNGLCAEEAIWHAKYSITEPDWLDVD